MIKELIARGQATLMTQQDAYTISQSLGEYIFPATNDGKITGSATVINQIKVSQSDTAITTFTIGAIVKPAGFSSIFVDNSTKKISFTVTAGTTTLEDHGTIDIPVIVAGTTYHLSFVWSKAKAGAAGIDANMLDWVKEWNTDRTQIGESAVITPKLFAGVKNADGTLTGTAIGRYFVTIKTPAETLSTETVDGISGFRNGNKTFCLDNGGNIQLGREDQYIRYDASTGKVEFGDGVSLQWIGATYIDKSGVFTGTLSATTVSALHLDASQIVSGKINAQQIDVSAILTAKNIEALTLNVVRGKIGGWSIDADSIFLGAKNNTAGAFTASGAVTLGSNGLRGCKWRLDSTGAGAIAGGNISWDAAGNVMFTSSVSLQWTIPLDNLTTALGGTSYPKLTQITNEGVYTGVLSAAQVTTGTLSADRIAVGSIKAEKLDAISVRASIVNADYVSGLNCTFTQGKIGGWMINSATLSGDHIVLDSANRRIAVFKTGASQSAGQRAQLYFNSDTDFGIFVSDIAGTCVVSLGSTNKIAGWTVTTTTISKGSVSLGADGSITNTTRWKLNNDGSGQLASGNISWNAAGAVIFSSAVSLAWTAPISTITSALGGVSYPKLTNISATGIYTGTLTASQVNAVGINAGSITTGTLSVSRLDAAAIKASIINADYISGLTCSFVRGTIGGWAIGVDSITAGTLGGLAQTPIQIRPKSSGVGYWYTGDYKPQGVTITWHQNANAGHIVFGQVAATGNAPKVGFVGIQMMSWDHLEYFCLSANYALSGNKEVYNRIAGWAFDHNHIWKNSVSLGADGSVQNGGKWQLNNDGSGRVASGNITWDAAGNVTFGASVALNWTGASDKGKIYLRGTGYNRMAPAQIIINGKHYRDIVGRGLTLTILNRNDLSVVLCSTYDVLMGDAPCNELAGALNAATSDKIVLLVSYDAIYINAALNTAIQRCGGMNWRCNGRYPYAFIGIPDIGRDNGLTAIRGDGASEPYAELTTYVLSGYPEGFSTTGKRMTYIDSDGIYTGTIRASQIAVDSTLVVGGSSYNGSISVRDAANVVKATLDRSGITAVGGRIGGWIISGQTICAAAPASGHRVYLTSSGYLYNDNPNTGRDYWSLKSDGSATFGYGAISFRNNGSGYVANGKLSWDAAGNLTAIGGFFKDMTIQGTVRSAFVRNDPSIWVDWGGGTSNDVQTDPIHYDNVVCTQTGGWGENINLQWTLNQSGRRICLINYKWGSTISTGYMSISAPSGKYFYENGIAKSTLSFSREVVELLGYGDNVTFFGWIVINRRDMMCEGKYGQFQQVLAQGTVTSYSGNSASIKYKTFDGSTMSVSKPSAGWFYIYMPWSLGADKYMVMLSGVTASFEGTPIYACIRGKSSSYFQVSTQDDASTNDGSFSFQVISMADFK